MPKSTVTSNATSTAARAFAGRKPPVNTAKWRGVAVGAALAVIVTPALVTGADASPSGASHAPPATWAGTWAAAVTRGNATGSTNAGFNDQSVRLIVHTTVSGSRARIRLTNIYGEQAVRVGRATVAKPDVTTPALSDVDPTSVRPLTFNGATEATMRAGTELLSDPVNLPVAEQEDLVVTVWFPTPTGPTTFHGQSQQNNFVGAGDLTGDNGGTGFTITRDCCWFFLSGVDVLRPSSPGALVVLSDSLGDANGSTLNANQRWPDLLAARLIAARPVARTPGVLNTSLAGNRLNHEGSEPGAGGFPGFHQLGPNALARLDEDVYAQTGVRTVITHLGINDIWMNNESAADIIATLRQINQQVRERGLRSLVATIAPYEGNGGEGVWTPEKDATREAVNAYLRTSREFDGVIDFDRVLRDPARPSQLLPALDSGDHIHPNDAGNRAMADAVPLRLLGLGG
jgi:lysophospholipase L1-like esterase